MPAKKRYSKLPIVEECDESLEDPIVEEKDILIVENDNDKKQHMFISMLKTLMSYAYWFVKFMIKISGVYLFWIGLHYGASHLYIHFCVPSNFFGFLISPFMTASPHCQGLRWIIYTGANTINNMWVILGTWLCSYLLSLRTNTDDV